MLKFKVFFLICIFLDLFFLDCVENTSVTIRDDALLQVQDFFQTQNKLFERDKHFVFDNIVDIIRLDRKKAEIVVQYVRYDNYMTVDQTTTTTRTTFLVEWQEQGRLVVSPEGDARRVHWVLTKTWEYKGEGSGLPDD